MNAPAETMAATGVDVRTTQLFEEQQQRIYAHTDRVFARVMVFQWFLGVAFALWISPRTWEGAVGSTHVHVWAALILGGAITAFPVALALSRPGARSTRHAIAIGQMLTSALLIHLTGGRIEAHFHVFGSLAFLAFYRDVPVLITASAVVLIDHFLRGVLWPQSVYGVLAAPTWRVLEHAAWVVFEDVVLIASSRQSLREMRAIAERQARLEAVNVEVEGKVRERTAELQEQRRFLRQVIDTNPNFVFVKDREGRFTLVNEAAAQAYGTTANDLVGKRDADFNANAAEVQAFRRDDLAVMNSLEDKVVPEEVLTDSKGKTRVLQTVKRPIVGPDGVARHVLGVATDITERKKAEEALIQSQKMEAIGRLAGGVAHDFNNLLTVISGFANLLLREMEASDPRSGRLHQIRKAADRASALTAQLLAFTRKQVLQPRVLDLNATLREMESMLRRLIGADIALDTAFEPHLHRVKADPGQIGQVILNLAVNARDAMPQGGHLHLETANVQVDKRGACAMVVVSDTGHGMDAATQARIFEPFFTTKEPGKGTGLGLATVYGIVEQSGGFITVSSEPDHGTTFRAYFPAVSDAVDCGAGSVEAKPAWRGRETILLVEDDDDVRAYTREVLVGQGYAVLEAANGQEALHAVAADDRPIHLLLTDMVLPGLSGPRLAYQLTGLRARLPVLYMSGYADTVVAQQGLSSADVPILHKPFAPDALARVVREILDRTATAVDEPPHRRRAAGGASR